MRTDATTESGAPGHDVLISADGVRISAVHHPDAARGLCFVVAHGFTGSWRRPKVAAVMAGLHRHGGVVGFDFRGHGASGGASTVGDREVLDLDAAVAWAHRLGYRRVATVGFSMGGSVVVRHAALYGGVDAVVAVSAPSRWYYRGTPPMRRLHAAIDHPVGRFVIRTALHTRVSARRWSPIPAAPKDVAARLAPIPLLVVHGDNDTYFPIDHPHQLYAAAREPKELWIEPGLGHAENAVGPELVERMARWVKERVAEG